MKTLMKALSIIVTVGMVLAISACAKDNSPSLGFPTHDVNSAESLAELREVRKEITRLIELQEARNAVPALLNSIVPAEESVQSTEDMTERQKILDGNKLVAVGNTGFYCPAYLAKRGVRKWKTVGANPYTGTFEHALKKFNWVPAEVTAAWKKIHDEKKEIAGSLNPGDIVCEMMFSVNGDHKRWGPVTLGKKARYAPSQETEGNLVAKLETIEYRVEHKGKTWVLAIPPRKNDSEGMPLPDSGCNNPSVMILGPAS